MTDSNEKPMPLWQKILYIVMLVIVVGLLLWGADSIGLLGFLAGAGF
tara:strand:- start:455 stop:595 length:141 start_codon:yes stop_codon:yes gene_type:complete